MNIFISKVALFQVSAVMGPSGAGKSTLLSVLMGTASGADFQGQVWINGRAMKVSRLRRIMGYVPQVRPQRPSQCLVTVLYALQFMLLTYFHTPIKADRLVIWLMPYKLEMIIFAG